MFTGLCIQRHQLTLCLSITFKPTFCKRVDNKLKLTSVFAVSSNVSFTYMWPTAFGKTPTVIPTQSFHLGLEEDVPNAAC